MAAFDSKDVFNFSNPEDMADYENLYRCMDFALLSLLFSLDRKPQHPFAFRTLAAQVRDAKRMANAISLPGILPAGKKPVAGALAQKRSGPGF